MLYITV